VRSVPSTLVKVTVTTLFLSKSTRLSFVKIIILPH
jgi:hypothetical protein